MVKSDSVLTCMAVLGAFATALSKVKRVAPVAPFGLCFDAKSIGSTRVGPGVPAIDLVLQSESVYWRIFGANSMVAVSDNVLCLGFVDAGTNLITSIARNGEVRLSAYLHPPPSYQKVK
ncbi:basic 7S globulin-like protein [Carex littledalei]|uniref:Basic 7S globulin-like protein n=1 Tax=Carex littledalei TaxID=544730 RepID=A0A833QP98_9POAL|nr:basic 7S globulin-like protein [Carex littledalei]